MKSQQEAIAELYAKVSDPEELAKLKHYLELSVKMAPITPDHHFYIDQGIYSAGAARDALEDGLADLGLGLLFLLLGFELLGIAPQGLIGLKGVVEVIG